MKEKDKMLAGLPYRATNPRLLYERNRASKLIHKYNKKPHHEYSMHNRILKKLLNTKGNFWIKPPFYCDYGSNIYIGKNFLCNFNCVMLDVCKIEIGDNVLFGPNVQVYTAGHSINPKERLSGVEFGKEIHIGNNVWIGGGSILCPGVSIGENSVIGAGSVVTKKIPPNVVAYGNPCKIIKTIN